MDDKRRPATGHSTCELCKLTNTLSKKQEDEIACNIIEALKKYPISYMEAHRVLDCVSNQLFAMADNLKL